MIYLRHLICWAVLMVAPASACNIPVFRYALERWRPDAAELIVFRDRPLSPEQRKRVQALHGQSLDAGGPANFSLSHVDILGDDPAGAEQRQLWKSLNQQSELRLPYVALRASLGRIEKPVLWQGTLTEVGEQSLLQSPVRREVARRLTTGHAIVWLVVGVKEGAKNVAARQLLETTFEQLGSKVQLPEGIGLPGSELHSEVPLLLRYSTLQVDLSDPREQWLQSLVRALYPDIDKTPEPVAIPVFGRGRALEVIPAGELTASLITDITVFLCGACSCQVKERNPGFDMLISADWETQLFGEDGVAPPDLSAERAGQGRKPKLLTIPPGK